MTTRPDTTTTPSIAEVAASKVQMKGISTFSVANTFIEKTEDSSPRLTPARLQKLVYFTAVDYAGRYGAYPFDELFMTWAYGPVLMSLREAFSRFGPGAPITAYASAYGPTDAAFGRADGYGQPWKSLSVDGDMRECIDYVWSTIGGTSVEDLMHLTRKEGSAWWKAFQVDQLILDPADVVHDDVSRSVLSRY